jgi:hypothetical protein
MQEDWHLSKPRNKAFRFRDPLVQRLLSEETRILLLWRNPDASEGEAQGEVIRFLENFHPVTAVEPGDPDSTRNYLQYHRAINTMEREIRKRHDAILDRQRIAQTQGWYVRDLPNPRERAFSELDPTFDGRNRNYHRVIDTVRVEDSRHIDMPEVHEPPREKKPGMFLTPARDPVYSSRVSSRHTRDDVPCKPVQPRYRPFGERDVLIVP